MHFRHYFIIGPYSFSFYIDNAHNAVQLGLYVLDGTVAILLIRALKNAKERSARAYQALQQETAAHLAADAARERLLALIDLERDAIVTATPEVLSRAGAPGPKRCTDGRPLRRLGKSLRDFLL